MEARGIRREVPTAKTNNRK